MSKRKIVGLIKDWFGVNISLGSISRSEQVTSKALKDSYVEAHTFAKTEKVKHADETGWTEHRKKAWLWCLITNTLSIFMIRLGRGKKEAFELLGKQVGILVTDRWHAYNIWTLSMRQLCWAHLIRHFQFFSECPGKMHIIGEQLLLQSKTMFHWWYRVRDGTMSRSRFQTKMKPLKLEIERLLELGSKYNVKKASSQCKRILKLRVALWTFIDNVGVEPTNNTGERAIRSGVLWRNGSFGTHSAQGSRFVERMLTASGSLHKQNRNVIDFVTESVRAHHFSLPKPSLLPSARFCA